MTGWIRKTLITGPFVIFGGGLVAMCVVQPMAFVAIVTITVFGLWSAWAILSLMDGKW